MCTSIAAGINATKMGRLLIARNEDAGRNGWNKYLCFRSKAEYIDAPYGIVTKDSWTLGNGLTVPVPSVSYPYSAAPDAVGKTEADHAISDHYYFEERGINSENVAISATNSLAVNPQVKAIKPLNPTGVIEAVIPTLILPQATSAKQGVELLGGYVEKYGAGEGNGVLFADLDEVWYVEIGSTDHWVAVRVPDDSYLVIANGMRIHNIDLDADTTLSSPGIFEFVTKNSLLNDPDRSSFNFAKAFGLPGDPYNVDREWLAQSILSPSLKQEPRHEQYPLFLTPEHPITEQDVMRVLRADYKNTALENIAERSIGVHRTAESHIITLDPNVPAQFAGTIWQCIGSPLEGPYIPLANNSGKIPDAFACGDNKYSADSAYWLIKSLYTTAQLGGASPMLTLNRSWCSFEVEQIAVWEQLSRIVSKSTLQDTSNHGMYNTDILNRLLDKAKELKSLLITSITNNLFPHELDD